MDIDTLKEALGDKFEPLKTYVTDLIGQRDAARQESIEGRKGTKSKLDAALARVAELEDWGGLDAGADLKEQPPAKGAVEAARQFDAKIKRLERERDEAKATASAADGKWRDSQKRAAVAEALGKHEFLERDIVESYVGQRLVWEGEDLLGKADDGKLVPVSDLVATIAKTRPGLLKPTGAGGAGARQANAGSSGKDLSKLSPVERINAARAAAADT